MAVLVASAVAACGDAQRPGLERASARLHANVEAARERLQDARTREPLTGRGEFMTLMRDAASGGSRRTLVTEVRMLRDGAATVDAAFHERRETGGGLEYESTGVRMCVAFTVPRAGLVTVTAAECPRGLPDHVVGVGTIDSVLAFRG
jgi:hypothetical protein